MKCIQELNEAKTKEFKSAVRTDIKQCKVAVTLMLDLLAEAYNSEILIHQIYFDRANDILSMGQIRIKEANNDT